MRLKNHESPRSMGKRANKGPKASARARQLRKAKKQFLARLRGA